MVVMYAEHTNYPSRLIKLIEIRLVVVEMVEGSCLTSSPLPSVKTKHKTLCIQIRSFITFTLFNISSFVVSFFSSLLFIVF